MIFHCRWDLSINSQVQQLEARQRPASRWFPNPTHSINMARQRSNSNRLRQHHLRNKWFACRRNKRPLLPISRTRRLSDPIKALSSSNNNSNSKCNSNSLTSFWSSNSFSNNRSNSSCLATWFSCSITPTRTTAWTHSSKLLRTPHIEIIANSLI